MNSTAVLEHYLRPLQRWLKEDGVTEIVINRPGEVGIERRQTWSWHEVPELSPEWLMTLALAAAAFTRQDVGPERPICSTTLPGGARCQIVVPPVADGPSAVFTIRRRNDRELTLDDLAIQGFFETVEQERKHAGPEEERLLGYMHRHDWLSFFAAAVQTRKNIIVSGATGSGKTTFARSLILQIPREERLVTIEDARELAAPHRNLVHLVYAKDGAGLARVGAKDLLESALRMRPDRIIMQELRDASAFFYLRNVASGHPGSITTVHAQSPRLAFEQLTLLIRESEAGRDLSRPDISELLRGLIDIVVQTRRVEGRFRVTEVYYDPQKRGPQGF